MRYKKDEKTGVISIYRNKRKPIRRVKEMIIREGGCLRCSLYDMCSFPKLICDEMLCSGVISLPDEGSYLEIFFANVSD